MLMTQWLAHAVETVNGSGDMARYFTRCGCLLKADGSNDGAIRLEGLGPVDYMKIVPPLLKQDADEAVQLVADQDAAARELRRVHTTEATIKKLTVEELTAALLSIGLSVKGERLAKNCRTYMQPLKKELVARLATLLGDDADYVTTRTATAAVILEDGPEPDDMMKHLEGTPSKPESLDGQVEVEVCVGGQAAAEFLDTADPGIKFHNVDVDVAEEDDVVELPLDVPTRELALAMEKFARGRKIDGAAINYYSDDGPDPLRGRDIVMLWDEPRGWFLGHVSRREKGGALFPGRTRLKTTNGQMTWRIVFLEDSRWSEYDLEERTEAMDLLPSKRGPGDAMSANGQWVLLEKEETTKKKKQKKKKQQKEKTQETKKKQKTKKVGYS